MGLRNPLPPSPVNWRLEPGSFNSRHGYSKVSLTVFNGACSQVCVHRFAARLGVMCVIHGKWIPLDWALLLNFFLLLQRSTGLILMLISLECFGLGRSGKLCVESWVKRDASMQQYVMVINTSITATTIVVLVLFFRTNYFFRRFNETGIRSLQK